MTTADPSTPPSREQTVVITGAAGQIASLAIPRLARPGRRLKLLDIKPVRGLEPVEAFEAHTTSITDLDRLTKLFQGADVVVHLAGQSYEAGIDDILHANVYGTYCVLEAARRTETGRVILASSNHAVGFHARSNAGVEGLRTDIHGRPDTLYGWSKIAAEALGQLYADRFGIDVFCLRIGKCAPAPTDLRTLALWLSPSDAARLIEACLTTSSGGYHIVWGVSRNTRGFVSLAEGEELGYRPLDDSERYAPAMIARQRRSDPPQGSGGHLVGGSWCTIPLGESNRP